MTKSECHIKRSKTPKAKNNLKKKKSERNCVDSPPNEDNFPLLPYLHNTPAPKTENVKIERVLPHWLQNPIPVSKKVRKETLICIKDCSNILHPELIEKLSKQGITHLFPVQETVIPQILSGSNGVEYRFPPRDICVATPTGSGKTLAFVLPIVQILAKKPTPILRALIILPVIELAKQVYNVFVTYASVFKLKVVHIFENASFGDEQRKNHNRFQSEGDILVATPGLLMKYILNTPELDFSSLRFFVIDEADKLLIGNNGQLIRRIEHHLMKCKSQEPIPPLLRPIFRTDMNNTFPPISEMWNNIEEDQADCLPDSEPIDVFSLEIFSPLIEKKSNVLQERAQLPSQLFSPPMQRLLFSATLTHDPAQLQNLTFYQPLLFTTCEDRKGEVSESIEQLDHKLLIARPEELTEEWVSCPRNLKLLVAHYLLDQEAKKCSSFKAIVFTKSVELTAKVAHLLQCLAREKYTVSLFSSKNRHQTIINQFVSKGDINVLVSSDSMSRGMDVPNVDYVMSYDIPCASVYVHRIGRTARAGRPGKAISIVSTDEVSIFKKMMGTKFHQTLKQKVDCKMLFEFETAFQDALNSLSQTMHQRTKKGPLIPKSLKR